MRTILGVVAPDEGEVLWRGSPADAGTERRFGYVPGERGLYPKMRTRTFEPHRWIGQDAYPYR